MPNTQPIDIYNGTIESGRGAGFFQSQPITIHSNTQPSLIKLFCLLLILNVKQVQILLISKQIKYCILNKDTRYFSCGLWINKRDRRTISSKFICNLIFMNIRMAGYRINSDRITRNNLTKQRVALPNNVRSYVVRTQGRKCSLVI